MSRAIEIPAELRGELVRLRPLQERDLAPFVAAYAETRAPASSLGFRRPHYRFTPL